MFNLRDRNIFSALSSLVTCVLVQDTLCHLCALLSVPHGFYSGLGGTKSSFKPQFAAPIFQYPVVITIIIPASLAAEACGWGGVDRWILYSISTSVSVFSATSHTPAPVTTNKVSSLSLLSVDQPELNVLFTFLWDTCPLFIHLIVRFL